MPLFEDFAAGLGGFAEGALAGRKLGLEQEALNLRRDEFNQISPLREQQTNLYQAQAETAMLELKALKEREKKKTTPLDLDTALQNQFQHFNPAQIDYVKQWYGESKPINEFDGTNQADFEDFVREMLSNENANINTPRLRHIARIGLLSNQKKIDGFKGDLQKIQEAQAKPGKEGKLLTTRELGEIDMLQSNINALEEINSLNMQAYDELSPRQGSLGQQALELSRSQDYQEAKSILKERMRATDDIGERRRLVQALIQAEPLAARDLLNDLEIKNMINESNEINISPEAIEAALQGKQ